MCFKVIQSVLIIAVFSSADEVNIELARLSVDQAGSSKVVMQSNPPPVLRRPYMSNSGTWANFGAKCNHDWPLEIISNVH